MVRVAPIKLQVGPKVLWFDPNDLDIHMGTDVIVNTSRGLEYGVATSDILEISDELVEELDSPLKAVERLATDEDMERVAELEQMSNEALVYFKELVVETGKDMHPVMVEYLFEGDMAVFYFEAEERVDFRELVRRLAAHFHVRVDMRQIGVRDGARIIGGLGHCGQELCCTRFGGEFSPVSIRMAKEQNLSLNPQKISGVCGRLMCCLRYEYDSYKEFNSRAPKMGAKIETLEGVAKVTDINVPSEMISIRMEDGTTLHIPLDRFEKPEEGRRPHVISEETYEEFSQANQFESLGSIGLVETVNFTGEEFVAEGKVAAKRLDGKASEGEGKSRRRRRNRSGNRDGESSQGNSRNKGSEQAKDSVSSRSGAKGEGGNRSRSRRRGGSDRKRDGGQKGSSQASANRSQNQQRGARPGQKSSGLSGLRNQGSGNSGKAIQTAGAGSHRRSRQRRHTTGGDNNDGGES